MKTIQIVAFLIFALLQNIHSQTREDVLQIVSRTETAISNAQKQMLAGQVLNLKKELSISVRYQALAIEEFKKSNFSNAACFSSKSREYASKVLLEAKIQGLDFYLINENEKTTLKKANCQNQIIQVSEELIDDKILLDYNQLRVNYKISIN